MFMTFTYQTTLNDVRNETILTSSFHVAVNHSEKQRLRSLQIRNGVKKKLSAHLPRTGLVAVKNYQNSLFVRHLYCWQIMKRLSSRNLSASRILVTLQCKEAAPFLANTKSVTTPGTDHANLTPACFCFFSC